MRHKARFAAHSLHMQYPVPDMPQDDAHLVYIHDKQIFVRTGDKPTILSDLPSDFPEDFHKNMVYLGHLGTAPCYALSVPDGIPLPQGGLFYQVRELAGRISDDELAIAGLGVQLIHYDLTTRFCGRCGSATSHSQTERAKICPRCHQVTYPRLSPAIIVLVQNKNSILMVRGRDGAPGRYGLIAGFVEPCETIEQAVHREVYEETGISIQNIRYCASEPWPFPDS
ncbi:NAD(+) diphosphatase, partial [Methanospirillum hungatei]|uniref:NAD(+) diphosphatase n=1 Tax=Methanospirillum hungatei TaxID=2203 RepID=UPI0026EBB563